MEPNISKILEDLYSIDPGFKKNDTELRHLLIDLAHSKPNLEVDETFVRRLKIDLMHTASGKFAPLSAPISPYASKVSSFTFFNSSIWSVVVAVLIFVPLTYFATAKFFTPQPVDLKGLSDTLSQKQQITYKTQNAFGPLVLVATTTPSTKTTSTTTTQAATTTSLNVETVAVMPAGLTNNASTTSVVANVNNSDSTSTSPAVIYSGAPIKLTTVQGNVLKRTSVDSASALSGLLQTFNFDLGNLSSFSGLTVNNVQLSEDKTLGYTISVNIDSGTIDISPNLSHWTAALDAEPISGTLSDSQAISIANAFLQNHTIDTSNYGQAQIGENPTTADSNLVTVIYPLILNKQEVYNQDGSLYGLTLTIDARMKLVTTVNNLTSQTFDASQYNLETNSDRILSYLKAATSTSDIASSTAVVLSTPQQILVRYVTPGTASTTATELFVPALLFPASINSATTTSIIVPLVKDFAASATTSATTTSNS